MTHHSDAAVSAADLAQATDRWEATMQQFDQRLADRRDAPGGIVFIGSSTFTRWQLADYFRPSDDLVNRGFGGSQLWEVVHFAPRLLPPLTPRGIFLYAGDNDLAAGRTPQQVARSFDDFVDALRQSGIAAPVVFVSIKPSPLRQQLLPQMREANQLIHEHIAADGSPQLSYLDVHTRMLDAAGRPRDELFVEDRLHLSHQGYLLWADLFAEPLARLRRNQ